MSIVVSLFMLFFYTEISDTTPVKQIDTIKANHALFKSKKLYFNDALAARDITYDWCNKLHYSNNYKIRTKFNLQHARNDEVCGSIEAAIEVYSRAINDGFLFDKNSLVLAESYARRGNAFNAKGESQLAIADILNAKRIYEHHKKVKELIWCEALIANSYLHQQSLVKAKNKIIIAIGDLEHYETSLLLMDAYFIYAKIIWKEKIDNEDLPFAPVRAIRYLDTALLYLENINNKPYTGMALKLLADIKNLETKYEESLQLARRANALFEESNFLVNWVGSKISESLNLLNLGRHEEVVANLQKPIELAAKSGWLIELNQMYSWLAVSHATLGNNREGAINGSRAFTIYKHIVKQERELQMEALEANYEKEKQKRIATEALVRAEEKVKQRNIVLFFLFILSVSVLVISLAYRKITKQNRELYQALEEKERLAMEKEQGDKKTNLTVLKSLLF